MRIYLQISGQESIDVDNLSPFQVRILLQKVLTVSEWATEERYNKGLNKKKGKEKLFFVLFPDLPHCRDVNWRVVYAECRKTFTIKSGKFYYAHHWA